MNCRHGLPLQPVNRLYGRCLSVLVPEPRTLPPYTLYTCIKYNTYSHGEGGRFKPERNGDGQQFTKLNRKYQHDRLYLQSINSDKHLPEIPLQVNFFRWRRFFCLGVSMVNCVRKSKNLLGETWREGGKGPGYPPVCIISQWTLPSP